MIRKRHKLPKPAIDKKQKQTEDEAYEYMKEHYPDTWAMLQRDWRENSKHARYSESTWMEPLKIHGIGNKIKYWDLVFPSMAQHKPKDEASIKEEVSRDDVEGSSNKSEYEWKQVGYVFIKVKKGAA